MGCDTPREATFAAGWCTQQLERGVVVCVANACRVLRVPSDMAVHEEDSQTCQAITMRSPTRSSNTHACSFVGVCSHSVSSRLDDYAIAKASCASML